MKTDIIFVILISKITPIIFYIYFSNRKDDVTKVLCVSVEDTLQFFSHL